ncbi:TPA: polyprenyl synthetase family protein [Streptococcus pyogenes]|uniref:polyprenyl synthetase family protein n=1 Tax=Streptococcus pyogenes TaxID=1314 RepID=UPI0003C7A85B|nr:farnesyl diphosphate synthase [Streptococcus pyogenes]HER4545762.1 polyprenyl synthetase family protein [Streptococcus pyogenes NGAS726]HER4594037.1 polyprenyl synthetase family protein [Streptococcus pyogenes NGAS616]HER4706914.1 polyprenyl synthetase family protein [Streptococcus pyogenes NGAS325]AIQ01698.1 Octaprenyl diphosphate synthase / Dimethylallyltransferase / (2E,6E)-farnesyl diphosphate synthase / Geranylgeranyl diphosphate synthase [Streptococcus pyogenes]AXI58268.1 polyprenyl s
MDKLARIDEAIRRYYKTTSNGVSEELIDAILYSVDSGGKRIRPLILLEMIEGFGVSLQNAHFDLAAALEMIHTGSLIHDDLPAMDNDDYRRGRLTNHKQFGEATAILAGDSLFLDPFGLIAQAELNSEVKVALIQELSLASGTFGMVGGQMLDMKGENQALSLPQLSLIHLNKTGKLLAFPFKAAALVTEQAITVRQQLEQAGMLIGHAFQIRDDILDVTASFEDLGKTPKKDLFAEKATYPSLLGLEASYQLLTESLDQALTIFQTLESDVGFKPQIITKLIEGLRLNA